MADVAAIWLSTRAANPFFLIQGTSVGLYRNFGGGLSGTLLVGFLGIVSMEAVLNFTGIVEIEFTGAMKLRSYILYPRRLLIMGVYMLSLVGGEAFRCHRGDEVMSSFDWRKKFVIKKGRRRSTKRQYLIGLKIMSHIQLKETCHHKKP
ncbi:hypothetical protein YC2023_110420 [Brassica napus]